MSEKLSGSEKLLGKGDDGHGALANARPPDKGCWAEGRPLSFAAMVAKGGVTSRFPELQFTSKSYGKKDGFPAISFSSAEYLAATQRFKHSLVAKFQAGRPLLQDIRKFMMQNWKIDGKITISSIWDDRHILIILDSERDSNSVLASPLRRIGYTSFRLFRWSPELCANREETRTTKWVRLPGLPVELFDKACMRLIINSFAVFIDIDERTKLLTGLNYARACIEVDVKEVLPEKVWVNLPNNKGFFQSVEIEGSMTYCVKCRKHGHGIEECRKGPAKERVEEALRGREGIQGGNALEPMAGTPIAKELEPPLLPRIAQAGVVREGPSQWTEVQSKKSKKMKKANGLNLIVGRETAQSKGNSTEAEIVGETALGISEVQAKESASGKTEKESISNPTVLDLVWKKKDVDLTEKQSDFFYRADIAACNEDRAEAIAGLGAKDSGKGEFQKVNLVDGPQVQVMGSLVEAQATKDTMDLPNSSKIEGPALSNDLHVQNASGGIVSPAANTDAFLKVAVAAPSNSVSSGGGSRDSASSLLSSAHKKVLNKAERKAEKAARKAERKAKYNRKSDFVFED